MTDVTVRQAAPTDLEPIVAANIAMAMETEGKKLDRDTVTAGVAAQLADPSRGLYYVAEQAGLIVGQLALTWEWSDWRNGTFWWIQSVYVAAGYRRRGIYARMYGHVAEDARRSEGVAGLRLYVDKSNSGALAAYKRLGMKVAHYDMLEVDFSFE